MAAVRIPESAKSLLSYCRAHPTKSDDFFFPSYAHLIMFAAGIGCYKDEYDDEVAFCDKEPYPIPMDIFQNVGLLDYIYVIGLSKTKNYNILNQKEELCKIIEGYSSAGLREMLRVYERCAGQEFLHEWVQELKNYL